MAQAEKHRQRTEGILKKLNVFLDQRFEQARRVNPTVGTVEADVRWHQVQTVRQVLNSAKGFGPIKLYVSDILCATDELRKRELFDPVNQVSILNEIVPMEDKAKDTERRAGMLSIRDVKSFYKALDPSLEKIVELVQTWIWWDLRDSSEMYRFDMQMQRVESLSKREVDKPLQDFYRKEMGAKPGIEIPKKRILRFELMRAKDILDAYAFRSSQEGGHQRILVKDESGELANSKDIFLGQMRQELDNACQTFGVSLAEDDSSEDDEENA